MVSGLDALDALGEGTATATCAGMATSGKATGGETGTTGAKAG